MPGEPPASVWIIDDQQWPRAALRAELLERGYEAVGFRRVLHALARLEEADVARPAVVVLELRGQPRREHGLARRARERPGCPSFSSAEQWSLATRRWLACRQRRCSGAPFLSATWWLP